jgi:hypothetical protein
MKVIINQTTRLLIKTRMNRISLRTRTLSVKSLSLKIKKKKINLKDSLTKRVKKLSQPVRWKK